MATREEITNRFVHHPPVTELREVLHEGIRMRCEALAQDFNSHLPESREKSLALTALQEAAMWANAAIAIHEPIEEVAG